MKAKSPVAAAIYLLFCMVFLAAMFALQGALLTSIIESFELDAPRQGICNAAAFAGGILALVTALMLQGRVKKRTLLMAAMALCTVSLAGLWPAGSFAAFASIWFVLGYGIGMIDTLLSACMADLFTGRTATMMMCIMHMVYGLTSMLAPIGFGAMIGAGLPWRSAYLAVAIWGAAIACAGIVISFPRRSEPRGEGRGAGGLLSALVENRLILPAAAMLFHGVFISGLNTWINRYAESIGIEGGIPAMSYLFFGLMLSRLIMAFAPIPSKKYIRIAGFAAGAVLLIGLYMLPAPMLKPCVAICGLLFGAMLPCIVSLSCEGIKGDTLLATTALMLALYVGQGLSSPIISALGGWTGLRAGMAFLGICMMACSACCAVDRGRRLKGRE